MAMDERVEGVNLKIDRAKAHYAELRLRVAEFLASKPYKVETKREARGLVYFLSEVTPTPKALPILIGDVLHSLRSALDHLACQLVEVAGATPSTQIYFPICKDAAAYARDKAGKTKGMRPVAIAAIDGIKPYGGGGNDTLWRLHALNIVDKHRLLITVGAALHGVDIARSMASHLQVAQDGQPGFSPEAIRMFSSMQLFLRPADPAFPLTVGTELYIDSPDAAVTNTGFMFSVAMNEPDVPDVRPIFEPLDEMIAEVERVVAKLRVHLA